LSSNKKNLIHIDVASTKTKILYGTGAFGYGSIGQTVGSFLMFFGTGVLGIPGTLMGIAVAVSTVWDASTDPIVGHWSDRVKSRRFGKRHGFIYSPGFWSRSQIFFCGLFLRCGRLRQSFGRFWDFC